MHSFTFMGKRHSKKSHFKPKTILMRKSPKKQQHCSGSTWKHLFQFLRFCKNQILENCGNWICPLIIDQDISMNDTIWLWSLLNSLIVWRHWYVNGTHMAQFRNWGNTYLTLSLYLFFFQNFFVSLKQTSGRLWCGWSIGELFGVFTFDNFWRLNHKAENRFCPTCRIPTKISRNSYFLQTVIGRPALSKNCCIIFPFFTSRKFSTGLRNEVWYFVAFLCYFFSKGRRR